MRDSIRSKVLGRRGEGPGRGEGTFLQKGSLSPPRLNPLLLVPSPKTADGVPALADRRRAHVSGGDTDQKERFGGERAEQACGVGGEDVQSTGSEGSMW